MMKLFKINKLKLYLKSIGIHTYNINDDLSVDIHQTIDISIKDLKYININNVYDTFFITDNNPIELSDVLKIPNSPNYISSYLYINSECIDKEEYNNIAKQSRRNSIIDKIVKSVV